MDKSLDEHIKSCLSIKITYPWATNYNCLATYVLKKRMSHAIITRMFYELYNKSDYPLEKEVDMLKQLFELNWVTENELDGRRDKRYK